MGLTRILASQSDDWLSASIVGRVRRQKSSRREHLAWCVETRRASGLRGQAGESGHAKRPGCCPGVVPEYRVRWRRRQSLDPGHERDECLVRRLLRKHLCRPLRLARLCAVWCRREECSEARERGSRYRRRVPERRLPGWILGALEDASIRWKSALAEERGVPEELLRELEAWEQIRREFHRSQQTCRDWRA